MQCKFEWDKGVENNYLNKIEKENRRREEGRIRFGNSIPWPSHHPHLLYLLVMGVSKGLLATKERMSKS